MATVGWWPPHTPGVLGFASPAVVNQAPAKSAPGLGPSGFDPHAFARPGLRAPLALRQGEPYPEFVKYDTGESQLARARPGDATAAIRICEYRPVSVPVAAGLGAYQPDRRLRLATEPKAGRREVPTIAQAITANLLSRSQHVHRRCTAVRRPCAQLSSWPASPASRRSHSCNGLHLKTAGLAIISISSSD